MIHKKAQATLYIVFIITALIIVTIAAVFAPMGVRFNAAMYAAGQGILEDAQPDIDSISDSSIRTAVNNTVTAAKDAGATNITVNANIFQYSWVVIIILAGIVAFLQTRRLVEFQQGGLV